MATSLINRAGPASVALESTLLLHGVPRDSALPLFDELEAIVGSEGAHAATIGVLHGRPVVGLSRDELAELLDAGPVAKLNTANLGVALHRAHHGATTVSATMELAALAGVRVFATGGLGGVHRGYGEHWDVSADLFALTQFPVGVVASGVKNLLDVGATREFLETLGVPVLGFRTERFPAFYFRESPASVDASFDDEAELAAYLRAELGRTGRGVLVCNPIPPEAELDRHAWDGWLASAEAQARQGGASGRGVTPAVLGALHGVSGGATLRANLALVRSNAALGARLALKMGSGPAKA